MVFGTPGGDQQDQWTLQFFLNVVEFGMEVQEAIEAPRCSSAHFPSSFYPHNAVPGLLRIESRVPAEVRQELAARGHKLEVKEDWSEGDVLGICVDVDKGILRGGADPRGEQSKRMPSYVIGW
jgi:gamma-glutamyltranspeptidase/glutathione hydrolase